MAYLALLKSILISSLAAVCGKVVEWALAARQHAHNVTQHVRSRAEARKERQQSKTLNDDIGKFGMWVNDNIVGNPLTFVIAILTVLLVYAAIPFVGGYASWNTGLGLFFNTLSSSFELITGIGAVVGVVVLHRKVKGHRAESAQHHADLLDMHETHAREVASLHEKVDQVLALRGAEDAPLSRHAVRGADGRFAPRSKDSPDA